MTTEQISDNSIINSLKRLERAGSENSRGSQKLIDATIEAGDKIVVTIRRCGLENVELPRSYVVLSSTTTCDRANRTYEEWGLAQRTRVHGYDGYEDFVHNVITGKGDGYCCGDHDPENWFEGRMPGSGGGYVGWPRPTFEDAQSFAKDIADGLLDEIAAFLEERAAQATSARAQIEQHMAAATI